MNAFTKIDLRNRFRAEAFHNVDEHCDVDAISLDKGELFKNAAATAVFTRKWLHDFAKIGKAHREKWSRDKFGDASTATNMTIDWTFVKALHESNRGISKEWAKHSGNETRAEVTNVGIAPHDDVALRRVQRLPKCFALAMTAAELGKHRRCINNRCSGRTSFFGGSIGGMVVDHDDFVDEGPSVNELGANAFDDLAHGGFFIAGRDAHRDRCRPFGRDEFIKIERAGDVDAGRAHLSIVGETGLRGKADAQLGSIGAARWSLARIAAVRHPLSRFLS